MIQSISNECISKICSGQVILDLSSSIKELIENSLDAKSTIIEIKLKEYGYESIEVSDNGIGINKSDYSSIGLKHYTSKLSDFNDLLSIKSFGFRGEAINSLCQLSNHFYITTRTVSDDMGSVLNFYKDGRLESESHCSRGIGTSVFIEKLFATLPVRRLDFERSIKRQYQRLIKLVQAYALISTNVKIILANTTKNNKSVIIATEGNKNLSDNISCLFGNKFLNSLTEFTIECNSDNVVINDDSENLIDNYNNEDNDGNNNDINEMDDIKLANLSDYINNSNISGYISKPGVGVGRSDNDRQFLFCNGRPIDLPKVIKIFNEVWRKYEMKNKPAFIVNINIPDGSFDINLSPDKREIIILHELELINQLKSDIDKLYSKSRNTFIVHNSNTQLLLSPLPKESEITKQSDMFIEADINDDSNIIFTQSKSDSVLKKREYEQINKNIDIDYSKSKHRTEPKHHNIHWNNNNIDLYNNLNKLTNPIQPLNSNSNDDISSNEIFENSLKFGNYNTLDNIDLQTKIINKEDFLNMQLIGQFNLGFIIALYNNDLFILDQHACDEKYQFETLQIKTKIHQQPLLYPQNIETTALEDIIVRDHVDIFERNGFKLSIDNATNNIQLLSIPYSKDIQFGIKDIHELASLISIETDGNISSDNKIVLSNNGIDKIILPKIMSMYASRACRKAVMIGTALNYREMKSIVNNLSNLDQPWNCPHGRPTMRHLINLNNLL